MNTFLTPIKISIYIFPIIFILTIIPYIIYISLKYKSLSKFKAFIVYTFIFYIITAFFLTMLPLPNVDKPRYSQSYQLIPFNFIRDILKEASINIYNPRTYVSIFTGRAFFQAFFNVLLTLPLGVYIRYLFKKDIKVTMLVCFLFSIFVEVTQLTGIYGIYKYPYRLFDVDDLMLNTLGGVIGFYIEPVFEYVLPSIEDLENKSVEYKKMASFTKRFIAFVLDWILFNLIFISEKTSIVSFLISSFIYFMLVPYITKGVTFGCFIVGIRIKSTKETLSLLSLFKRYGIIIYIFLGVNKLLLVIGNFLGVSDSNIILLFMLIQLAIDITCIINIITHVKRNDKILIFDKLSNTYVVSK